MNENANKFAGGRIEVYDQTIDTDYSIYEARFWIPLEMMEKFRELFDFVESDELPNIIFDYKERNNDGQG